MDNRDGGSAFPRFSQHLFSAAITETDKGMSLRDYFAGKAIAALLANVELRQAAEMVGKSKSETVRAVLSEKAYQYADAMLAARVAPDPARISGLEMLVTLKAILPALEEQGFPKLAGEVADVVAKAEAAGWVAP